MEGTPEYLDYTEIMETFLSIEGVVRVHNLRIWVRITGEIIFFSPDNYKFTSRRHAAFEIILNPTFYLLLFLPQALSVNKIALAAHLAVRKFPTLSQADLPKLKWKMLNLRNYALELSNPIVYFLWLSTALHSAFSSSSSSLSLHKR